ncbi:PTS system mannose-specific EIIBCA component domain protein, partial [Vibrio parahaemolyticus V-223/04]
LPTKLLKLVLTYIAT